jgi:thiol-disulfide isomerase/thioredoxin
VAKTRSPQTAVGDWCERHFADDRAPAFRLPPAVPVRGGKPPAVGPEEWVWVNLWATWCKPCLREMPLILRFSEQLRADGLPLQNWFLSLDDDLTVLAEFLRGHPELAGPNSLRLEKPDQIQDWMKSYGLPADTSIPVSVLRAPGQKVRCIRTGSIHDGDYPMVKSAFRP